MLFRLLREPLLHFIVLGGLLFAVDPGVSAEFVLLEWPA